MSIKSWTPCDEIGIDGHYHCPYCEDGQYVDCEYYCGADPEGDEQQFWEDMEMEST